MVFLLDSNILATLGMLLVESTEGLVFLQMADILVEVQGDCRVCLIYWTLITTDILTVCSLGLLPIIGDLHSIPAIQRDSLALERRL